MRIFQRLLAKAKNSLNQTILETFLPGQKRYSLNQSTLNRDSTVFIYACMHTQIQKIK